MTDTLDAYPSLKQLPDESPAAYQAFIDYIDMGWERSINALIARYRKEKEAGTQIPSTRFATIAGWSGRFKWQERLGKYREDAAAQAIAQQRDYLDENIAWQLKMHRKLREQIESMVARFDELKIAKKTRVPDPRNPGQEIEVVYQRVNMVDLERLVKTYSELGEKLRKQLGLPDKVELTTPGVKTYIGFSPDEWDALAEQPQDPESE